MNKLKSIKLYMTMAFTILFTILLAKSILDQQSYVSLMSIMLMSYFGANAVTKFAKPKDK